jgi:hypothetical protein
MHSILFSKPGVTRVDHQPAPRTQRELGAGRDGDCGCNHRGVGEDSLTRGEGGDPGQHWRPGNRNRVECCPDRDGPRPRGYFGWPRSKFWVLVISFVFMVFWEACPARIPLFLGVIFTFALFLSSPLINHRLQRVAWDWPEWHQLLVHHRVWREFGRSGGLTKIT